MKRLLKTLALVGTLFLVGGTFVRPAAAGISISIGTGHYGHSHYPYYQQKHFYPYGHRWSYRHHQYPAYGRYRKHGHSGRHGCHPSTGWVRDHHGRKLKVVATRCYDAYGRSYLVPGSRRAIHGFRKW